MTRTINKPEQAIEIHSNKKREEIIENNSLLLTENPGKVRDVKSLVSDHFGCR